MLLAGEWGQFCIYLHEAFCYFKAALVYVCIVVSPPRLNIHVFLRYQRLGTLYSFP